MTSRMKTSALLVFSLVLPGAICAPAAFRDAALAQEPIPQAPQHKQLQKMAGTWDATMTLMGPDGSPMECAGVMVTRKHTDYFTVDEFQADLGGVKFVGHGTNGWCPVRKKHFTTWCDSMSPTPLIAWGDYDEAKKELALAGECMGMSGKLEPCRVVTKFVDDDHASFAMYGKGPDGEEMRFVQIEYVRRK
jgi:hypothetical protein